MSELSSLYKQQRQANATAIMKEFSKELVPQNKQGAEQTLLGKTSVSHTQNYVLSFESQTLSRKSGPIRISPIQNYLCHHKKQCLCEG